MPTITDALPQDIVPELSAVRDALDEVIPAKRLENNLLIATWNLRA